jgi:hypothetical protein
MKQKTTLLKSLLVIGSLFIAGSNLSAQTLEAHYKFDGNLLDETGNWNLSESAGFTAGFETGADGATNSAVKGFGAADYLETVSNFSISGSDSRTMAAWIKIPGVVGSGQAIIGLGLPANGEKWTWQLQGLKYRIEIQGKGFNVPTPDVTLDTWHHFAVVWESGLGAGGIRLYVDGVLGATNNWEGNVNTAENKLRVGNDFNVADPEPQKRGFTGAIDDLRIYTGAADDAFILALYDEGVLNVNDNKVSASFKSFPNPVNDRLYFSTDEVSSVEIYNILGSKMSSQKVNNGIDMSTLSKGLYLVKCLDSEGLNISTLKVIKE